MSNSILHLRIVDQITTATDKGFELVARIADEIVATTLSNSDCTQQELLAKGFWQQDVDTLWHFANALAAVELTCRKNGIGSFYEREARNA